MDEHTNIPVMLEVKGQRCGEEANSTQDAGAQRSQARGVARAVLPERLLPRHGGGRTWTACWRFQRRLSRSPNLELWNTGGPALAPSLIEHRDFIFREHLTLPLDF